MRVSLAVLCLVSIPALSGVRDPGYFSRAVYPVLQKAGCAGCHNPDGVASGTRLHFPEADAAPAAIESFGRSLRTFVDAQNPAESLLIRKPTKRIQHAGGRRIAPGSPEEQELLAWAAYLATLPDTGSPAVEIKEPCLSLIHI